MFRTHVLKCRCHQRNEFNNHHWEPTVTNTPLGKFDDLIPKSLNVDICKTRHSQKFCQSLNNMKVVLLLSDNLQSSRGLSKHWFTREYEYYWRPHTILFPLLHLINTHCAIICHWPVWPLGQRVSILTLDPDIGPVLVVARAGGGGRVLVSRLICIIVRSSFNYSEWCHLADDHEAQV